MADSDDLLAPFADLLHELSAGASATRLVPSLESIAAQLLKGPVRLELNPQSSTGGVPVHGTDGRQLGWLVVEESRRPGAESIAAIAGRILDWEPAARHISDLIAARTVLREMLPQHPLQAGPYYVQGWLEPARYIGGDCFDYLHRGNQLCFLLADAVGHSLAATMLSLECRALWRAFSRSDDSNRVAALLNSIMSDDERANDRFVAACLGALDIESGALTFTCCGLAPYFMQTSDGVLSVVEVADPPLGIVEDYRYRTQTAVLKPGDRAVFITDGVTEWIGPEGELFGSERLMALLREGAGEPPEALLERLRASLDEFSAGTAQRDDAAALVLWHRG